MKSTFLPVLSLLLGISVNAMAAPAVQVSPPGPFSASGDLSLGKSIVPTSCQTTFVGTVTADGVITITSLTFDGGMVCKRVSAVGLPWTGTVDSDRQLTLKGMRVNIRAPLLGGDCGPLDVSAVWSNTASSARFDKVKLPPDCRLDGTMVTTQRVTVTANP